MAIYSARLARVRARYQAKKKAKPNKKMATVGTVKRLINRNVDKERADSQIITAQNVTTTAVITTLWNPGNEVILDNLELYFKLTNPTLLTVTRIVIFQWKDTTTPVEADLLRYTGDPLSSFGATISDTSRTCGGKLHILSDFVMPMDITYHTCRSFRVKYYKKRLLDIKSDGNETKNVIYIMYLSDTAVTPPVLTVRRSVVYHPN